MQEIKFETQEEFFEHLEKLRQEALAKTNEYKAIMQSVFGIAPDPVAAMDKFAKGVLKLVDAKTENKND